METSHLTFFDDWLHDDDYEEDDDHDFTCDGDCGFCFAYDDEDE